MLDDEHSLQPPPAAPQEDSRGRIVAAIVLLALAAAGLVTGAAVNQRAGRLQMRDSQARMDFFQAKVVLGLTYYLESIRNEPAGERLGATVLSRRGALSAAAYFERAADGLRNPDDRTAAAASAVALYAHVGENLIALRTLQTKLHASRGDVLSLLARLYANQRLSPQWLQSDALRWISRNVPAHLIIESQVAESTGHLQRAEELRQAAYDAGARMAERVVGLLASFAVLMLAGLVLLLWGAARRGFGPYRGLPERTWGIWAGLELAAAWLLLGILLQTIGGSIGAGFGTIGLVGGLLGGYLAATVIALVWFALSVARAGGLRSAGWRRFGSGASIANGFGAYAAALPVVLATTLLATRLLPEPPGNLIVAEMTRAQGWGVRALFLLLLCVAAPIAEETVFRGGLYGGMRKRWTLPAAAVASSAMFAIVHLNWASFLPVMALGIALCLVYERTGSLLPGMVAHCLFNLSSAAAVFLLS